MEGLGRGFQNEKKLFVAGVSNKISKDQVREYFSQFGPVVRVEMGAPNRSNRSRAVQGRGHCIVVLQSEAAAEKILHQPQHVLDGRVLTCKPYLIGGELKSHNEMLNSRRVILKQVPKDIDPSLLKSTLEKIAGQIETFYVLRSDSDSGNSSQDRRHLTCSVVFKTRQAADRILEIGYIPGPSGRPIYARRYLHLTTSVNKKDSVSFGRNLLKIERKISIPSKEMMSSQIHSNSILDRSRTQRKRDRSEHVSQDSLQSTMKCSGCPHSLFHSRKPTCRRYFNYRRLQENQYCQTNFGLSERFNIGVRNPISEQQCSESP